MKTIRYGSILIIVLTVLIVTGGCATSRLKSSVYSGYYIDVKKQIEAGANVNARDIKNCTVLMAASFMGYTDIVELLIDEVLSGLDGLQATDRQAEPAEFGGDVAAISLDVGFQGFEGFLGAPKLFK